MRVIVLALAGIATATWPRLAEAQTRRESVVQEARRTAYELAQPSKAIEILTAALDPASGIDDAWVEAVQLLAQIHIEESRRGLAVVWLRWALRVKPDLQPDTVLFVSALVGALRAARDSLQPGVGEGVQVAWTWPVGGGHDRDGLLRLQASAPVPGLTAAIRNRPGIVRPADAVSLAPGTYELESSAPGYLSVRVSGEVLPGVTTTFTFAPSPIVTVTQAEAVRSPGVQVPAAKSRRRFPWPIAVIGLGAAGTAAFLLTRGGKIPQSTAGTVRVNIPVHP